VEGLRTINRYTIDERLASGASAAVFRGYDAVLHRPVAIKVLHGELAQDSDASGVHERFKRRARAAGRLFHPNIPATFDLGEDDGRPFIVMEYVEGLPLGRLIETAGPFETGRAVAILLQVLEALKYSYENRVVHLDLKPSAVLVLGTDQVKVADFGVALVNACEPTSVGEDLPTTSALAPEQLMGAPVDHRTDLFAAGALLFEMLTCTKPFRGGTVAEILTQMQAGGPEDVCALNAQVPRAFRSVIETALAYEPDQRFAKAGAFSFALLQAVSLADRTEAAAGLLPSKIARPELGFPVSINRWDPALLHRLETDLAAYIGPVAAIAVKRAAARADNLVTLREQLSVHLEDEKDREDFLAGGRRNRAAAKPTGFLQPANGASEPIEHTRRPFDRPDQAALNMIEAKLTQYLGPVARILLAQRLQNFQGLSDLCRNLADYISDESERAAFLDVDRCLMQS
jgi:eukaryotic-like serine/threonine-protein kinase